MKNDIVKDKRSIIFKKIIKMSKAWRNEKIISERISGGFSTFPGEISVKKHMFERSEFVLFRK